MRPRQGYAFWLNRQHTTRNLPFPSLRESAYFSGSDKADLPDFAAILDDARAHWRCPWCGVELEHGHNDRAPYCSTKHRLKFRDTRRYAENPDREREKSRLYYRRTVSGCSRRRRPGRTRSVRKGASRCRHIARRAAESCRHESGPCATAQCGRARYRRLNPERYAEEERRKVERRRAKRRARP